MRGTRTLLLALAGAMVAAPLAAQSAGTFEIGGFGRYNKFGKTLATDLVNILPSDNGFGWGGRLGIFLLNNLALEVDASYVKVDNAGGGKTNHTPKRAGFVYNIPLGGSAAFLLGARYVRSHYGESANFNDTGIGGLAGFRLGPLRLEGTIDKFPKDETNHGSYHNWGVQAGLSLLLGNCKKSEDGVTISPTSAELNPGERANFSATATRCGKTTGVLWAATGGAITETGEYLAGNEPGTYSVTATEPKSGANSIATVTIRTPPPPPPPPPPAVRLTRVDITPERARIKIMENISFSTMGINSDGTSRPLTTCTYTATGNPTQSGNTFSWARHGTYTVTVTCEGMTDTATVEVPLEVVIFGTNFAFNASTLTPAGRTAVRMAADSLKKYPDIKVRLAGHADFVGSDAYNCNLSWRRVHSVHAALNSFGITDDRFSSIEGFGEAYPLTEDRITQEMRDHNTRTRDKGLWWDRRVDITSAARGEGMTACAEPAGAMRR